jgi:glycosyltransferase involved in cell wall biosynthesis
VGEALACGTPVLASRVGGVPELVTDGITGWLVDPGDDQQLADALRAVLDHPAAVVDMRAAARRLAEARVSPEAVAEKLRKMLPIEAVSQ